MATESGRDDFIIAIRSAFLNKGNRQKFSLFTLLIISILVLSLEYFKSGPIDKIRSITKDIIFQSSYIVSVPFVVVKKNYYLFQDHMSMYENFEDLKKKDLDLEGLKYELRVFLTRSFDILKLILSPSEFLILLDTVPEFVT